MKRDIAIKTKAAQRVLAEIAQACTGRFDEKREWNGPQLVIHDHSLYNLADGACLCVRTCFVSVKVHRANEF